LKRNRIFLALAALELAISFLGLNRAEAQTPAPKMTVTAAFSGTFKYGEWLPLLADIENSGGDVEAVLRVRVENSGSSIIYAAPVSLPAGAHKLIPLYVLPNNFSRVLEVQLSSSEKLLVSQKVQVRPQPNINYLVGFLSAQRGALALLNGVTLPGQERVKVLVDLTLDEMPERMEGLSSFNTLVINDVDTSKMTTAQAAALQSWVEQGGRLVIGGGAGAQRTFAGLPQALQPVQLDGTQEVQAADLTELARFAETDPLQVPGPFVLAKANLNGGRSLAAGKDDLPLVVERGTNKGTVDFVALDLSAAPFEGWSGTQAFWSGLLSPGAAYPDGMPPDASPRQMRSNTFYGALSNIPSLDLPSIQWLSILLGLYILLVGPVNYFILRRSRRMHLAWVTIPAITAVFTAGAFAIGYGMRGSDLILNKVSLVEVQNEGPALVTSYVGLFSPRQQSYEIEVQASSLLSPAQFGYGQDMTGVAGGPEMTFVQGRPSLVQGLSVNQWSMQSFVAEDTWPEFGRISGKVSMTNETLTGTVRNDTNLLLKDVVITVNRRFQRLGDLNPGQEVKVDLGLSDMNRDTMGPNLSYKLYMEPFNNANGRMPRDVMLKTNILDNALDGVPWGKMSSSAILPGSSNPRSITVFGWTNQAPPEVSIRGQMVSQMTTTLVYTSLELTLPEKGRVVLPPGMLTGRLVDAPRGMGSCGPNNSASIFLDDAEAAFEFQLPVQLQQFTVDTLKISVSHDNANAAYKGIAVYNWTEKKWVVMDKSQGETLTLHNAGPYIDMGGQVRLRVSAGSGNPACYFLDLGVEAERAAGQGG
jgi:hypothetical protein